MVIVCSTAFSRWCMLQVPGEPAVLGDSTAAALRGICSEDMSVAAENYDAALLYGSNNIVVCVNETGGHFADGSRWFEEASRNYAFVLGAIDQRKA